MLADPMELVSPPRASNVQERAPGEAPARLDVLVAEDDDASRAALCRAIRDLGHDVRAARDGVEALRLLGERHADVIVSDWDMPGMNGAELCRRTRVADDESPYVYFILVTSYGDREHLIEGMAAGADDYQKKPLDLDELEARLVSAARVVALHRRLAERTAVLRRDSKRFFVASRTDALTGAGNRLALTEALEAALSRRERYGHVASLAICDVDHFKAFNDRFGHLAGDEALRRVADTIRAHVRASDTCFRYGGEEFVVLFEQQTLEEATHAMNRVRREIERLAVPAPDGVLTVSAGVAAPAPGDDGASAWLARADAALYAAKESGRNKVVASGDR